MEFRCRRADGSDVWVSLYASFFSDARSTEPSLILQVQDISARRHAEARLEMIAFHDPLTGLPNRTRLMELLGHALAAANSDPGRHFAVLFLDFDRFKLINDSFGHAAGDRFLTLVAQRLQHQVRPGDVVARLGGDEFVVLVQKVDDETLVIALAERLQQAIARPFSIAGTEVITSASIGITFSRFGYQSPGDILRDADIAMYRAKADGKARHAVYDVALHAEIVQRVRIEAELRAALAQRTLDVHYQPIYDLATRTPVAFEALLRWEHAEMGEIAPAVFVPIAEEAGLVTQLTDFVMTEACGRLRQWVASDPTLGGVSMHVNLSGVDLAQPQLAQRVLQVLARYRLKPQQLVLELTENILMRHLEASREKLAMLSQIGVGLSVDDFGTGYASLSQLTTLPVNSLKIDRSFVDRIGQGGPAPEFLRAVVMLGRSLGMTVVAEGIETEAQCAELHAIGCDRGQGYLLARPMTASDIETALVGLPPHWNASLGSQFMSAPGTLH
jgi:diguanylate cyclase (GGDEF)-like protein